MLLSQAKLPAFTITTNGETGILHRPKNFLSFCALGPSTITTLGLGGVRELGRNVPSYARRILNYIKN